MGILMDIKDAFKDTYTDLYKSCRGKSKKAKEDVITKSKNAANGVISNINNSVKNVTKYDEKMTSRYKGINLASKHKEALKSKYMNSVNSRYNTKKISAKDFKVLNVNNHVGEDNVNSDDYVGYPEPITAEDYTNVLEGLDRGIIKVVQELGKIFHS